MSTISIARLDGEPRAVFSALEHHWRDHPQPEGLHERIVMHGRFGFAVIERWDSPERAEAAWAVIRLEGVPTPDLETYEVLARSVPPERSALGRWLELALPDASAWDEPVVPRDS